MKFKLLVSVFCLLFMFAPAIVNAGVLPGLLTNDVVNTLEDADRELFIDLFDSTGTPKFLGGFLGGVLNPAFDASKVSIDPGDALIGIGRVEDVLPAQSGGGHNQVYVLFSQTFATITAPAVVAPLGIREFTFAPTTEAGLKLSDLLGPLDPGGIAAGMLALISDTSGSFSIDLAGPAAPPDVGPAGVDFGDYLAVLHSEGMLDAVLELVAAVDYLGGSTVVPASVFDFVADISTIPSTFVTDLVSFTGGFTMTNTSFDFVPLAVPIINEEDGAAHDGTLTFHDAVLTGGNARAPSVSEGPAGFWTFSTDADILFVPVPEPGSILVWAGLLAMCGLMARRRRK